MILLAGETYVSPAAALVRAADVVEVIPSWAPFDAIAGEFADAARRAAGELVFPVMPDGLPTETVWQALATAAGANPDAGAFRLQARGLAPERAWRGRRCRSHERNLESLRFAHLIAPGALAVRREVIAAAARRPRAGAGRRLVAGADPADRGHQPGRRRRGDDRPRRRVCAGEPACPSFAPRLAGVDVLVLGQIEVSASLYFDFLESAPDVTVAFRAFTSLDIDAPHLAAAGLVVLVRTLHRFWDEGGDRLPRRAAAIPFVWFTDDNFLALRAEDDASLFYPRPTDAPGVGRRGGGLDLDRGAGGRPQVAAPPGEGLGPGAGPAAARRRAAGRRAAHRRAAGRRLPRRGAGRPADRAAGGDGRGRAGPRGRHGSGRQGAGARARRRGDRGARRWSARSASSCGAGGATGRTSCCTRKALPPTRRSSARPR